MAAHSGTLTFLLTDVEASTRLWERYPEQMGAALARHDALFESIVQNAHGEVVRPRGEGDSRFAVFARATDAVAAACAVQIAFCQEPWTLPTGLRVRIGVHTGEVELRDGDYYGSAVNRCARLRAIGHGGQVLLSAATISLTAENLPQGASLRDLGTHRLKDLSLPERVYQLVHPALPADFPRLSSATFQRTNLPVQPTSFVGREREMAAVRQQLDGTRLMTLSGPGGGGKTRLALQVAADAVDDYDDGVWLVELAPVTDAALVPRAVSLAVGAPEVAGRPLLETLLERLRDKHVLLVLDNCEHLIRPCAILVETLLRTCPDVRVLATSREALNVAGELAWTVPPLSVPGPDTAHASIGSTEAAALFLERAAATRPGFQLTTANAPAIAEVCRRLDGMPLAIELAAARVRVLSPEQIAQRLDNRFHLLTGGLRTAPTRQQTLQAALDWSFDLLSAQEQALFARLSTFVGGFDLEQAESVCVLRTVGTSDVETDDVLDLLTQLVDKSLVIAETLTADGTAVRYHQLETLREYAHHRLAERDETAALRRRHAEYFMSQAVQAESNLSGHRQAEWLERLESDHDNLLAAMKWAVDTGGRGPVTTGLVLASAIRRFWAARHPREGSEWLAKLLSMSAEVDPEIRAGALNAASNLAQAVGDLPQAAALQNACVDLRRDLGDALELSVALNGLGGVLIELEDYPAARPYLEESLELRRGLGEPGRIAIGLATLAELNRRTGDLSRATALGHEGLLLAHRAGDETVVASCLNNLGYAAHALGRDDEAARLLCDAAAIFYRLGNRRVMAECCHRLAEVACRMREGVHAARLLGASSALQESVGYSFLPAERAEFERARAATTALIGETAYAAAWLDGHDDALSRVLASARDALSAALPVSSTPPPS